MNDFNKVNKKKKKSLFNLEPKKIDFSAFDPITGEKKAAQNITPTNNQSPNMNPIEAQKKFNLALMEAKADASKGKDKPYDMFEIARDGTIGTGAGFALGNLLNVSTRAKGAISLGLGGLIAGLGAKKHLSEYNKQMASRELLSGIDSDRARAYRDYLRKKYGV